MGDLKSKIDDLAGLMTELGLDQAKWSGEDWSVKLSTEVEAKRFTALPSAPDSPAPAKVTKPQSATKKPAGPSGIPVSSPMTGIFYSSPSPGAPAFAKAGDQVNAGQVVGLIEAMKVFNEITAPTSGRVTLVKADNGQLVQPGEPLLYIE